MQMYDGGFISLHRSIMNWDWYTDQNTKSLFIHLLLTANYMPGNWRGRHIEAGQRVTSLSKLADELKMSVQEIRTALKHLEATGEITKETSSQYTVITVKNYVKYQSQTRVVTGKSTRGRTNGQQASNRRSTNEQQQMNKNNKGIREQGNKYIGAGTASAPGGGASLPPIGEGECSLEIDGELHLFPARWYDLAEQDGRTIEDYVRWRRQ